MLRDRLVPDAALRWTGRTFDDMLDGELPKLARGQAWYCDPVMRQATKQERDAGWVQAVLGWRPRLAAYPPKVPAPPQPACRRLDLLTET